MCPTLSTSRRVPSMRTLESKGKKIAFPDTMSPDEIRAVLKVLDSPGKYAKLKSESEMMQACMDKLVDVCKAMEANESATKEVCETLCKAMDEAQKSQHKLIRELAPTNTEVTLQAPAPAPVGYSFKVVRDKDGQMTSVEATPNG